MTEVSEAEAAINERMPRWPAEPLPIAAVVARILAERIGAERDHPPFDRVTMDGIAIRHEDWARGLRRFEIAATQAAGMPPLVCEPGRCIEIMTGAMLPDGADTIVPVERLTVAEGAATIAADATVTARQFIHFAGSDRRAGDTLLEPGTRLGPAEVAVLASAGRADVTVAALPGVAVISTGDELVDVGEPVEPYQIRSSDDLAVAASLEGPRLARVTRARLRDDPERILATIRELHGTHDALILSGGVSMGQFDFVPGVLEALGCELVFHRINQKPGRPMWFGLSRDAKPVFALPGNPVSTLLCMTRYVLPAFRLAAGLAPPVTEWACLSEDVAAPRGMTYFVPVALSWSETGVELAAPRPTNTSGDFATLAGTDGFLELPAGPPTHPRGTVARLYRW